MEGGIIFIYQHFNFLFCQIFFKDKEIEEDLEEEEDATTYAADIKYAEQPRKLKVNIDLGGMK